MFFPGPGEMSKNVKYSKMMGVRGQKIYYTKMQIVKTQQISLLSQSSSPMFQRTSEFTMQSQHGNLPCTGTPLSLWTSRILQVLYIVTICKLSRIQIRNDWNGLVYLNMPSSMPSHKHIDKLTSLLIHVMK